MSTMKLLVDNLGRIVIPKEVRSLLGIKENDPFELFIDTNENCVCFRRYMPFLEPWRIVQDTIDTLEEAKCYKYAQQLRDIANEMKKEKND